MGTSNAKPLLEEPSVQYKPSLSETVEIQPSRKNFGTITNQKRPTVAELSSGQLDVHLTDNKPFESLVKMNDALLEDQELKENDQAWKDKPKKAPRKFGMLDGVLGRCLLCIWGVIMYLRTAWVVGYAGIWQTIIIILLASSVTFLTALSFSAICTNGEVKSGGYYFLISRSLGPEFGGVIGILFALALCFSVAMYLAGFSETIVSQYEPPLTGSKKWDIVLWAQITLVFIFAFSLRGLGGVVKFDMVLLTVLIVSIIVYFIGAFGVSTEPDHHLESIGYTGYSPDTFSDNWNSAYAGSEENWPSVFSVYFPAVTGEMAGANISGELRNPSYAIPYGTLSAIVISTIVYVAVGLSLGGCVMRVVGNSTQHGLKYNSMMMAHIAAWPPLVLVGMLASTLSSAISCFVGAPRIFQAVCQDNLFPSLHYFARCRESDGEPVRAYVLIFVICLAANSTGEINIVAPIVTNFFLITYAVMNYSTFTWSLTRSPGWRPTFRWYNKWVSLFASVLCIALMFLIDWQMALITVAVGLLMYKYVAYTDPNVNWGTPAEAHTYVETCKNLLKYQTIKSHAKVSRPKFLIFNRSARHVQQMYQFAHIMNEKFCGMTMIGDIIIGSPQDHAIRNKYIKRVCNHQWTDIPANIIKNSLIQTCISATFGEGIRTILQTAGVAAVKPNVALFNVLDFSPDYINSLQDALLIGMGVLLVAGQEYMDWTVHRHGYIDIWWLYDDGGLTVLIPYLLKSHELWKDCKLRIMALENLGYAEQSELAALMAKLRINAEIVPVRSGQIHSVGAGGNYNYQQEGNINSDVDDSERSDYVDLNDTLFLGSRLRRSSYVEDCQKSLCHEVFTYDHVDELQKQMKKDKLLSQYAKRKLKKYKKLGELIERSRESDLCVVTMPFPRSEYTSYEYMKILQALTPKNMNNLIFVRGNQDQVLTFAL